jgi:hypothetical protein
MKKFVHSICSAIDQLWMKPFDSMSCSGKLTGLAINQQVRALSNTFNEVAETKKIRRNALKSNL